MEYEKILKAPIGYWKLTKDLKKEICNGVGPKGLGWLFPNTIWLLDVSEAADIHDYMYHVGRNKADKVTADQVFLNNLLKIIEYKTYWDWLLNIRCNRALFMVTMVENFGDSAFWKNKLSKVE